MSNLNFKYIKIKYRYGVSKTSALSILCLTLLEQKLQRFESLFWSVVLYRTDYIYFGTRSIIVFSEKVTILHIKYIAKDRLFCEHIGVFEGYFALYTALWKVNIN